MSTAPDLPLAPAQARASAYLLFSILLTSPRERRVALDGEGIAAALERIAAALPNHAWQHQALRDAFAQLDNLALNDFDRAYGGLFEVAESACGIREEHAGVAGKHKEEVVRYYEHFGYRPLAAVAWQPDHLAVELEFLYFLIEGEQRATDADAGASWRLAQHDFCARHPASWVPGHAQRAAAAGAPGSLVALLAALESFLAADLGWQRAQLPTH